MHISNYQYSVLVVSIFIIVTDAYGAIWHVSSQSSIDWGQVKNGDTVCLYGTRTGSLKINKSITIDGNCRSTSQAVLNGAVYTKWKKSGDAWVTVNAYPLDYDRYASWVLVGDELKSLEEANIYRVGNYFYSKVAPHDIRIPVYYSAIVAKDTDGLIIKNLSVRYYHTHGLRISNSKNTVIDNVSVSWIGGGINPSGFPRAGDGITFDGNTSKAVVKNSSVSQCFDTGFTMQLFKNFSEYVDDFKFENVRVDRCGAGLSVAIHKNNHSMINNVDISGVFSNLGYGWSGVNNSVHGRGVMVKQFEKSDIRNVKLHNSIIDTYAWVGILQYSGELYAWDNVIKNGTGEYLKNKYVRPAAYTAHGMDYTKGPSDGEAVGRIYSNKIVGNNAYVFQIINNRPKQSTQQLTIKDNFLSRNSKKINIKASSNFLR